MKAHWRKRPTCQGARQNQGEAERKEVMKYYETLEYYLREKAYVQKLGFTGYYFGFYVGEGASRCYVKRWQNGERFHQIAFPAPVRKRKQKRSYLVRPRKK